MKNDRNNFLTAIVGIVAYTTLFIRCVYLYLKHLNQEGSRLYANFRRLKLLFFALLATSALYSIPLWVECIILDAPNDCEWEGGSYAVCWGLHLLALVGFSGCIGIPTIMWSDIINGNNFVVSGQPLWMSYKDPTRVGFVLFFSVYLLNEVVTILSMLISTSPQNIDKYFDESKIYRVSIIIEPFIISLFAGSCLIVGIRLQLHVLRVRLYHVAQHNIL